MKGSSSAITLIQRDLEATNPRNVELVFGDGSLLFVVVDGVPEGGVDLSILDEESGTFIACVADQVQDHVIDALWSAWPKCPRHAHPLRAAVVDKRAMWICPAAERLVAEIGELVVAGEVRQRGPGTPLNS